MKNVRYKLVPLDALPETIRTRAETRHREVLDACVARGVDYETAQERAMQATGCEVVFDGDDVVVCMRQGMIADRQSKRTVERVRDGVVRRTA